MKTGSGLSMTRNELYRVLLENQKAQAKQIQATMEELIRLRQSIPNESAIREVFMRCYAEKLHAIEDLRDEAVRVLKILCDEGLIARERLGRG